MKTDMTLSIRDFTPALGVGRTSSVAAHIKLKQIFFISENTAAPIMLSFQYTVPLHPFRLGLRSELGLRLGLGLGLVENRVG